MNAPADVHPPDTEGLLSGRHRAPTIGIVLVITLLAFEAMAIGTIMPVLARALDGLELYAWGFSASLLTTLLANVVAGGWCDREGPALPLLTGLAVFAGGLVIAGAAPVMWVFVVGRAVQGIGAGTAIVAIYVIIARAYPDHMRPRVFAATSTAWVVPSLIGPAAAGFVAEHLHWRAVFLGLIPLVIPAALMLLPASAGGGTAPVTAPAGSEPGAAEPGAAELDAAPGAAPGAEPGAEPGAAAPRAEPDGRAGRGRSHDSTAVRVVAAVAAAFGAALLLYAIDHVSWRAAPLAVLGLAGLGAGLPRLLPPGALLLRRGLPVTVTMRGLLAGAFFGAEAFIPLALTSMHGFTASQAGVVLTVGALGWTAGSWAQSRSTLARPVIVRIGSAVLLAGIAAAVPALRFAGWPVAPAWLVTGFGMGLALSSLSVLVLKLSPPSEQGVNSAALQLSDTLGAALGIGLGGALITGFGFDRLGTGLSAAGGLTIVVAVVALAATFRLVSGDPAELGESAEPGDPAEPGDSAEPGEPAEPGGQAEPGRVEPGCAELAGHGVDLAAAPREGPTGAKHAVVRDDPAGPSTPG